MSTISWISSLARISPLPFFFEVQYFITTLEMRDYDADSDEYDRLTAEAYEAVSIKRPEIDESDRSPGLWCCMDPGAECSKAEKRSSFLAWVEKAATNTAKSHNERVKTNPRWAGREIESKENLRGTVQALAVALGETDPFRRSIWCPVENCLLSLHELAVDHIDALGPTARCNLQLSWAHYTTG
jgi:hypothetical protein